jgi:hypothetical protein
MRTPSGQGQAQQKLVFAKQLPESNPLLKPSFWPWA